MVPYEHKDPAMKRTYSGASAGAGVMYEWDGDKNVGSGRIEIADTSPPQRVAIKLDMISRSRAQPGRVHAAAPGAPPTSPGQ